MRSGYRGHFNDGKTAARRAVFVVLAPSGLEIADPEAGDGPLAIWPYEDLRVVGPARPGAPVRLARDMSDESRLTLPDGSILTELADRTPGLLAPRRRLSRKVVRRFGLALGGAAAAAASIWFLWPPLADAIATAVPSAWEARLGRQIAADLAAGHRLCDDPPGVSALDRLSTRLAAGAGISHGLVVQVIDLPEINAFAAPGGQILLLRGLIEAAESGDEVAGVLAHEIGHVAERHGMRSLVRHLGVALLFQVISGGADLGQVAPVLLTLAYSREFEAEADGRAVELLARAGLRTDGLARFFARLERKEGALPVVLAYLSTHPPAADRQLAVTRAAAEGKPAMTAEEWQALRRICP